MSGLTNAEISQVSSDEAAVQRICDAAPGEDPGFVYNVVIPSDQIFALKRYMETLRKLLAMDTQSVFEMAMRLKRKQ